MKKGTIILWMVVLTPLLCITAQWWRCSLAAEYPMEVVGQWEQSQQQLPLEDDREYSTGDMLCLLRAVAPSASHVKSQGGAAGNASVHTAHLPLLAVSGHSSSHLPFPIDGCSVIIRLHHLII